MLPSHSFTLTAPQGGLLRVLQTKCGVSLGFTPAAGVVYPEIREFDAIWDTGATASVITQRVVDACGLLPTGMTQVHGVGGTETSETYLVNILLPNNVGFQHLTVTKGKLHADADVLIGMDIIASGDFAVTNNGKTVFSFRVPSQCAIDFVEEHNRKSQRPSHGGSKKDRKKRSKRFGKNK